MVFENIGINQQQAKCHHATTHKARRHHAKWQHTKGHHVGRRYAKIWWESRNMASNKQGSCQKAFRKGITLKSITRKERKRCHVLPSDVSKWRRCHSGFGHPADLDPPPPPPPPRGFGTPGPDSLEDMDPLLIADLDPLKISVLQVWLR